MRRWARESSLKVRCSAALIAIAVLFPIWRDAIERNRSRPDAPFTIAGNLHHVGATGVTSFLLTGDAGHILIDGGYPENAPLIIDSIAELGYDIRDVKVLVNSHAHFDHAGGLAALQRASGAELWVSKGDAVVMAAGGRGDHSLGAFKAMGMAGEGLFDAPRIDHQFEDGAVIRVGNLEITAHVTAGHTPGCTSWSFPVRDGERELLAVNICSLTVLPTVSLVEPESYPGIREGFERSFETLRGLPADIFLASHASFFAMKQKRQQSLEADDPVQPFVDRAGYLAYSERSDLRFRKALAEQQSLAAGAP